MTTNWYLDVDGVINAFSSKAPTTNTEWCGEWSEGVAEVENAGGFGGWATGPTYSQYRMFWSHELIHRINKIAQYDSVNIIWLTTWADDAPKTISPLMGLDGQNWEVLKGGDPMDMQNWWKFKLIREHVEQTKPDKIIWTDDDLGYEHDARIWVRLSKNVLGITPNSSHGLTKTHINSILYFINN